MLHIEFVLKRSYSASQATAVCAPSHVIC